MRSELQNIILRAEVLSGKNWIHAVNLLQDAASEYPDEERVYLSLGDIYAKRLQHEKAISAYQKALALSPENDHLRFVIGNCYFALHEFRMALAYFDKIVDQNPEVLYNRALVLAYTGAHKESIEMIHKTLQYVSDNPFIYFLLIEQLLRTNDYDEALKYLRISEQKIGAHKHLLLLGAVIYSKKGIWIKSYNAFYEYEKISVFTNSDHLHAYGICAWKIGQYPKAINLFQSAIEHSPYVQTYYEDLIRVLIQTGDFSAARKVYHSATTQAQKPSTTMMLLKERLDKAVDK